MSFSQEIPLFNELGNMTYDLGAPVASGSVYVGLEPGQMTQLPKVRIGVEVNQPIITIARQDGNPLSLNHVTYDIGGSKLVPIFFRPVDRIVLEHDEGRWGWWELVNGCTVGIRNRQGLREFLDVVASRAADRQQQRAS